MKLSHFLITLQPSTIVKVDKSHFIWACTTQFTALNTTAQTQATHRLLIAQAPRLLPVWVQYTGSHKGADLLSIFNWNFLLWGARFPTLRAFTWFSGSVPLFYSFVSTLELKGIPGLPSAESNDRNIIWTLQVTHGGNQVLWASQVPLRDNSLRWYLLRKLLGSKTRPAGNDGREARLGQSWEDTLSQIGLQEWKSQPKETSQRVRWGHTWQTQAALRIPSTALSPPISCGCSQQAGYRV